MKSRIANIVSPTVKSLATRVAGDQRGAVALVYALLMFTMLIALGTGVDLSNAMQVEYRLDLAADAGAVACGEAWQSTMESGAGSPFATVLNLANTQAHNQGLATFYAQAEALGRDLSATPTVVATPTGGAAGGAQVQCNVTYSAYNANYIMQLAGFKGLQVTGSSQTTVTLPPYVAVYLIVDTSASMLVGSNIATQKAVSDWMGYSQTGANYTMVFNNQRLGQTPCGFACHDDSEGGPATTSIGVMLNNMNLGEQVASYEASLAANSGKNIATRFDVMRAALVNDPNPPTGVPALCTAPPTTTPAPSFTAGQEWTNAPPPVLCSSTLGEGLLAYIRKNYQGANARINLNTFTYSLYGFNQGINGGNEPYSFATVKTDYSQYAVPQKTGGTTNQTTNPFGYSDLTTVAAGVNNLMVGMNTHLNDNVMPALQSIVMHSSSDNACHPGPKGSCSADPLRFVIIITDGLMSDRDNDYQQKTNGNFATNCIVWNGSTGVPDYLGTTTPEWYGNGNNAQCNNKLYVPGFMGNETAQIWPGQNYQWTNTFIHSTYASPIAATGANSCATLQADNGQAGNGSLPAVTVAVLETPYIPMNGQQPNTYPYEENVQWTIYPNGPNTTSELSTALSNCASPGGFYYQATSDTAIATGFQQLFNTYIGQWVHLTQ